jgi:hypothetical protein
LKNIILVVVLWYMSAKLGFLFIPRQEPGLRVFKSKMLRIFACTTEEVTEELGIFHKRTCIVHAFYPIFL